MKNVFTFLSLFLWIATSSAQIISVNETVYFDHDSDLLNKEEQAKINYLIQGKDVQSISLKGHTDGDGSDAYNIILSQKRVASVKHYLNNIGVSSHLVSEAHFGESQPVQTNENEAGKQSNRRVEITLTYKKRVMNEKPPIPIEEAPKEKFLTRTEMYDLFKNQLEVQRFYKKTDKDLTFTTKDGLIFYFDKNAFDSECGKDIEIQLTEYNDKRSMIYGNITTVSNGAQLVSYGMYEVKAFCGEQEVQLKEGKDYTCLVPYDGNRKDIPEGILGFWGERHPESQNINWIPYSDENLDIVEKTDFWIDKPFNSYNRKKKKKCFLKRWFGKKNNDLLFGGRSRGVRSDMVLMENAMNRDSLNEKYSGKDFREMEDLMADEIAYLVFKPERMGLANCDLFLREEAEILVNQKVKIEEDFNNTEVKLVYKNRRSVVSTWNLDDDKFNFDQVGGNEEVFVIALSVTKKGNVKVGLKEYITAEETTDIEMKEVASFDELDKILAVIQ